MPQIDLNRIVVNPQDAEQFSKTWTASGVSILLDKVHFKFAAEFATVALRAFIQQYMQKALAEQQPKIQVAE